jgi:thiol-disulfide isomerase/thioredoxin
MLLLVLLPLAMLFALSPSLRREPRRLNAWIALGAAVTLVIVGHYLFPSGLEAGLPWHVRSILALVPILTFGAMAHAWCAGSDRRARRAWLAPAAAGALLVGVTLLAPRTVAKFVPGIARAGDLAPPIAVTTLAGEPVAIEPGQGRVVVLAYWASWCGPCRGEQKLLDELAKGDATLEVVAVNNGESIDTAREAWEKMGLQHRAYRATDSLLRRYPAVSLPSSYVIDRRGLVHQIHLGFRREKLEPELRALLAAH